MKPTREELAGSVAILATENEELKKRAERSEALHVAASINVEELKVKLLDTQIALSRLEGFRDRVESDDTANDPLVPVKRIDGNYNNPVATETFVPKRKVTGHLSESSIDNSCFVNTTDYYGGRREEKKTKHWVNF